MKEIVTNRFIIKYHEQLEEFIKKSLKLVDDRLSLVNFIFEEDEGVGKLKASFFTEREDFVNYIKSIANGHEPPSWATGCFYNNEIQTLVNINIEKDVNKKIHTLTHEMVHLYMQNLIYNKYKIARIRWFDESYACYIDGQRIKINKQELKQICENLKQLGDFDMNVLDDVSNVKTNNYNGYDMFLLIGKYIFENNLEKQYVNDLITNPKKIREIGKTILTKAIEYNENS